MVKPTVVIWVNGLLLGTHHTKTYLVTIEMAHTHKVDLTISAMDYFSFD